MKDWIISNMDITPERYDSLINSKTVIMDGLDRDEDKTNYELSDHPINYINNFTYKKSNINGYI